MAKISDLTEAFSIGEEDLLHVRTTGGVDKKLTGETFKKVIAGDVKDITSDEQINLNAFKKDLLIFLSASKTLPSFTTSFSSILPRGKKLIVVNNSPSFGDTLYLLTVRINSNTYTLCPGDMYSFVSDGSTMLTAHQPACPYGYLYVQYPSLLPPSKVFNFGVWINVSGLIPGRFIRFEGKDGEKTALPFDGGTQSDSVGPHSHSIQYTYMNGQKGGVYRLTKERPSSSGRNFSYPHTDTTLPYANETRPINVTARLWKRTG